MLSSCRNVEYVVINYVTIFLGQTFFSVCLSPHKTASKRKQNSSVIRLCQTPSYSGICSECVRTEICVRLILELTMIFVQYPAMLKVVFALRSKYCRSILQLTIHTFFKPFWKYLPYLLLDVDMYIHIIYQISTQGECEGRGQEFLQFLAAKAAQ